MAAGLSQGCPKVDRYSLYVLLASASVWGRVVSIMFALATISDHEEKSSQGALT